MKIIDLDERHLPLYFHCLEDWSDEMRESGGRKSAWYASVKDALRVKLAVDDDGTVGGMIQYLPIEKSYMKGSGLYVILCIWVHGYDEGRGNFQKRGIGTMLLQAAEEDARALGAKGMAAWGLGIPVWMKASWFKKHRYRKADRDSLAVLLWKPFSGDARPPQWIKMKKKPELMSGRVTVTSFTHGWCPAQNIAHERAKRAAAAMGEKVIFQEVNTLDRGTFEEWGMSDALFIDGKQVRTGPPPSYESILKKIEKRARRLK